MSRKTSISRSEIEKMWEAGQTIELIDVRSNAEFQENHIPDAININIEDIESGKFSHSSRDSLLVTVCGKGGGRSERAATYLRENGGYDACFLEGGTFEWNKVHG